MAVYLPELDALFLHIPKTAGTWVKAALLASGLKCEAGRGLGDHGLSSHYANAGKRIAFVRHPLAWIESVWRGVSDSWPNRREIAPLQREKHWEPIPMLSALASDRSFDGFVENLLTTQRGFVGRMYEWYVGPPGCPTVEFVGRQEHLRADLQQILQWLGWNGTVADLPRENVGPINDVIWHHSLQTRFLASECVALNRWYHKNNPGPWRVTLS